MSRLRSSVRSRKGPRTTPAVVEAVGLYVALRGRWSEADAGRLDALLRRLSPREEDAYYDGIRAWRATAHSRTESDPAKGSPSSPRRNQSGKLITW